MLLTLILSKYVTATEDGGGISLKSNQLTQGLKKSQKISQSTLLKSRPTILTVSPGRCLSNLLLNISPGNLLVVISNLNLPCCNIRLLFPVLSCRHMENILFPSSLQQPLIVLGSLTPPPPCLLQAKQSQFVRYFLADHVCQSSPYSPWSSGLPPVGPPPTQTCLS